jgi:hypothetical protein
VDLRFWLPDLFQNKFTVLYAALRPVVIEWWSGRRRRVWLARGVPLTAGAGDLVTWALLGNLPHIGLVTDHRWPRSGAPLNVHNTVRVRGSKMSFSRYQRPLPPRRGVTSAPTDPQGLEVVERGHGGTTRGADCVRDRKSHHRRRWRDGRAMMRLPASGVVTTEAATREARWTS